MESSGTGERPPTEPTDQLVIRRLLTEVNHLRHGRINTPDGPFYPPVLQEAVLGQLVTKGEEDAMSAAVSKTYLPVAEVANDAGECRRTFICEGLGRMALQSVAESGYDYHFSEPGFACVGIEVQEAVRREKELRLGTTQVMASTKFTRKDAPLKVARAEHRADEDAIRTSTAAGDENGSVTGCETQSLLVRDIPHQAWVKMFRDPSNMWGKSFEIEDEESALSIMQLFSQLDLPDAALPEGPVTIVAAVVDYIDDAKAKESVQQQLVDFRQDQDRLHQEAIYTGKKWLEFEKRLGESLDNDHMDESIRRFVIQLQDQWPEDVLKLLKENEKGAQYGMTEPLAAKLEEAWQRINVGASAVVVGDKRALKDVDKATAEQLKTDALYIRTLEQGGINPAQIAQVQTNFMRNMAQSEVRPGGGCSGSNGFSFGKKKAGGSSMEDNNLSLLTRAEKGPGGDDDDEEDDAPVSATEKKIGKRSYAKCRIPSCPTRPGKTEVGGCTVCLESCQPLFDDGQDPEDVYGQNTTPEVERPRVELADLFKIISLQEVTQITRDAERAFAAETNDRLAKMSGSLALAGVE